MSNNFSPTLIERAAYIAETCAELSRIAGPPRLRTLSYLVDVARIEAERTVKDLQEEERKERR